MRRSTPVLNLDSSPDVVARGREITTEEDQVDFHCFVNGRRARTSAFAAARRKQEPARAASSGEWAGVGWAAECDIFGADGGRHADVVAMQHGRGLGHVDDRRGKPVGFAGAA